MATPDYNEQFGISFGTKRRNMIDAETGELAVVEQRTVIDYGGEFYKKAYRCFFEACYSTANTATIKVLFFFLLNLKRKSCMLIFKVDDIAKKTGFKRTAIFAALKELEERDFIAKKMSGVWMFNPSMITDLDDISRQRLINTYREVKDNQKGELK